MSAKVTPRVIERRVIGATIDLLSRFSADELNGYALSIGVKCGQQPAETIANLMKSGRATLLIQLGD